MPSSPHTPTRHHSFSNLDDTRSNNIQRSPTAKRSSRSFSIRSIPSPVSLKPPSARDSHGFDPPGYLDGIRSDSNGLGNLADELAEVWDDECSRAIQIRDITRNVEYGSPSTQHEHRQFAQENGCDLGISMPNISNYRDEPDRSLSLPKHTLHRTSSHASIYDGSDYGENLNSEGAEGISASLEHRLAAIETLARRGAESNGSTADTIILRVAECLGHLALSAGVEIGASRLTTAYTAVASNIVHQTRLLQTHSSHFTSPFALPPSADELDEISTLLVATLELVPRFNARSISAIHSLHSSTAELISTLSVLADNLHMFRQTTSLASRKLKAAKEAVEELRIEAKIREEGIQWVERGDWNRRLSSRECGIICKEVVGGFKEVCEQWEKSIGEDFTSLGPLEVAAG
ncbi:MAG: hypothetical protein Q9213_005347 [Squamulea squamosa]